jgi:hypothetical protein
LLVYLAQWRVPVANSMKLEEMFRVLLSYVRSNRERYPQLRSAIYCSSIKADVSEEDWFWVDEYANREDYEAFYRALDDDKKFLEIHDKQFDFWHLIVEGSFNHKLYSERVRF